MKRSSHIYFRSTSNNVSLNFFSKLHDVQPNNIKSLHNYAIPQIIVFNNDCKISIFLGSVNLLELDKKFVLRPFSQKTKHKLFFVTMKTKRGRQIVHEERCKMHISEIS